MLLLLLAGILGAGISLSAHHSFAASYFEEQSITVTGELVEFAYRNPHAWVFVMAPDEAGQMQRYGAEWAGAGRLGRQGIDAETLKPGDQVVVTGSPGRIANEYKIHLKRIERPSDGWSWAGRNRRRR